jgi:hypothetical protein
MVWRGAELLWRPERPIFRRTSFGRGKAQACGSILLTLSASRAAVLHQAVVHHRAAVHRRAGPLQACRGSYRQDPWCTSRAYLPCRSTFGMFPRPSCRRTPRRPPAGASAAARRGPEADHWRPGRPTPTFWCKPEALRTGRTTRRRTRPTCRLSSRDHLLMAVPNSVSAVRGCCAGPTERGRPSRTAPALEGSHLLPRMLGYMHAMTAEAPKALARARPHLREGAPCLMSDSGQAPTSAGRRSRGARECLVWSPCHAGRPERG